MMTLKNILISINIVLLFTLSACVSDLSTDNLKVISFNIRQSRMGDQGDFAWDNRKETVVKMIQQEQPAIIGLQEVQIEQILFLEEQLTPYNRIGVGREDGLEGDEHSAIFYLKERFELLHHGDFWLSETPDVPSLGWDAACKRLVTWGKFQDRQTKKTFYFFNTHFDHVGTIARKESVLLIVKKIKEIAGENSIVFLTGDFNSTVEDEIFSPLLNFMNFARKTSPTTDWEGTYNGFGTETASKIIDYIFYKGVTPTSFKTLKKDFGVSFISDHYPVSANFKY